MTGSYRGRAHEVRWTEPDLISGWPRVPVELRVAAESLVPFLFTAPDGYVTVDASDPFSVWAFAVRLLDDPQTVNPPPYPAGWPQRPSRLGGYVA